MDLIVYYQTIKDRLKGLHHVIKDFIQFYNDKQILKKYGKKDGMMKKIRSI